MDYNFRIPANEKYLHALGRAFYNFTYLEKIVKDIIGKLGKGATVIPPAATAGDIHVIFKKLITSELSANEHLIKFAKLFKSAIKNRNKLLHANPYTALDGEQQVIYKSEKKWPIEEVYSVAKKFEEAAIFGSEIYHKQI